MSVVLSDERVNNIFNSFINKKIIVVGDLMIDEYLRGRVSRLSPEAPVPVVEIENEFMRFGGAANVALNLKTLGCQPILIGSIGDDRRGHEFKTLLAEKDMPDEGVLIANDRPTTVKTRIIGDNQHLARVDREKVIYLSGALLDKFAAVFDNLIENCAGVIIEDYNKGMLPDIFIKHIITKANQQGIISTADPKFVNFLEYKNVTVFKPNIKETAQALARIIENDRDVTEAGFELLKRMNVDTVLLTRGKDGLSLFEASGDHTKIPTKTRKVADVSGAGDTVISTITAAIAGGATYKEAACMANYAAGVVCGEVGIVPIEGEILKRVLKDRESA